MITIKKCTTNDLKELQELSQMTFYETFSSSNTEANIESYLEKSFNYDKLRNEMLNKNSFFYFIYLSDKLAGYLKLNEDKSQTDIYDPQSLEIERIYVAKEFQGKGLGYALVNKAIKVATQHQKHYIWLGVWEKNYKAIQFYKKIGFYEEGKHSFFMGDEEQFDYIMKKEVK